MLFKCDVCDCTTKQNGNLTCGICAGIVLARAIASTVTRHTSHRRETVQLGPVRFRRRASVFHSDPSATTHRREAVPVPRVQLPFHAVGEPVAAQTPTHRREDVPVPRVSVPHRPFREPQGAPVNKPG